MMKRSLALLGLFVVSAACASSGGGAGARSRGAARDVISSAELAQSTASNALDVIRQLRPHFLVSRGSTTLGNASSSEPVVYIDRQRLGGIRELSQFTTSDLEEIRFLTAPEATQQFGTGHAAGAIVLKRRRLGS